MDEYDLLVKEGNIGIYNSCEVTELVIMEPTNKIYNLYTLCVFQEKDVTPKKHQYVKGLCNRIEIDDKHSIGIFQYELELTEIKENFEKLINEYKWISNHKDESSIKYDDLRILKKQFIPSIDENRLNHVLKNNFYSGSYILEFFDEKKQFGFLTEDEENFERISKKINKRIPINLFKIRDRLGNFIFQFPVNILNVDTKVASDSWDSLNFNLSWHPLIKDNFPDCFLTVDSVLDNNYMGNNFKEYDGNDFQEVYVGNVDSSVNVKIWRKDPNLILYTDSNHYIKSIDLSISIGSLNKRYFMNDGEKVVISLTSKDFESSVEDQQYYQYINNSIGIKEKYLLQETLSFKQYTPEHGKREGLSDLRRLISENGKNGVYLWDPYLSFDEIINTLFYCHFEGVELKALGSLNKNVIRISSKNRIQNDFNNIFKERNFIQNFCLIKKKVLDFISFLKKIIGHSKYDDNAKWIEKQKNLFKNLNSNFEGLNLEFRVQIGKGAHDRFLIFPGNPKRYEQPKVYSLGTSVNSFGRNYHILQEVSYPQAVIREFNKIWEESKKLENLIWKYPE